MASPANAAELPAEISAEEPAESSAKAPIPKLVHSPAQQAAPPAEAPAELCAGPPTRTIVHPPAKPPVELSAKPPIQRLIHPPIRGATAPAKDIKRKIIQVKLVSREYDGPVPSREGFAYGGRELLSENFSVTITPKTTFNSLVRHLQRTMQRLKMGDLDRPYNQGVFRSMTIVQSAEPEDAVEKPIKKFDRKKLEIFKIFQKTKKVKVITKVIDMNWPTSRQILLEQDCSLRFDAWSTEENWDWHMAMQQTKKNDCICAMQ